MPAVVGSLPPTRGPHICGPYDAAKNKKPLTSNEISGFLFFVALYGPGMYGPRVGGSDPTTADIWNAKQVLTYDAPKKEDVD